MIIKSVGADKAPLICLIYDDCISNRELLKSNFFKKSFVMSRHYNCGVFILTQHLKAIPPVARNQCTNWFYFQNNRSTDEQMTEIHCPPNYSKKEMQEIIEIATAEPYSFLFINRSQPFKTRYRIKLNKIINLTKL
jgi:hypothetical protein